MVSVLSIPVYYIRIQVWPFVKQKTMFVIVIRRLITQDGVQPEGHNGVDAISGQVISLAADYFKVYYLA